jgi:hypothetical protein
MDQLEVPALGDQILVWWYTQTEANALERRKSLEEGNAEPGPAGSAPWRCIWAADNPLI